MDQTWEANEALQEAEGLSELLGLTGAWLDGCYVQRMTLEEVYGA